MLKTHQFHHRFKGRAPRRAQSAQLFRASRRCPLRARFRRWLEPAGGRDEMNGYEWILTNRNNILTNSLISIHINEMKDILTNRLLTNKYRDFII